MSVNHRSVVLLLAMILALPALASAQDRVIMAADDPKDQIVHRGQITYVNLEEERLTLKFDDGSLVYFPLATIDSIMASDAKVIARWAEFESGRDGGQEDERGRGGLLEGGVSGGEGEKVMPDRKESEQIEKLIGKLGDKESTVDQLVVFGRKATMQLCHALAREQDQLREGACHVLGRIHDHRAIEVLVERVDDTHDGVRLEAVTALGQIAPEKELVWKKLLERAREEQVDEVMKAIVIVLGEVAGSNHTLQAAIVEDSYDADPRMAVYYSACRAMLSHTEVGSALEGWLNKDLKDDIFFAACLSNISLKRDVAIGYLIDQIRPPNVPAPRTVRVITALRDITTQDCGYLEAKNFKAKRAAVKAWIQWWSQGSAAIPRDE